jgi:hypothetical protein
MMDAGTQAKGGIGRKTSKVGNIMPYAVLFTAKINPNGIPISIANKKPENTRLALKYQLDQ